jgi:hypothetical protein
MRLRLFENQFANASGEWRIDETADMRFNCSDAVSNRDDTVAVTGGVGGMNIARLRGKH